jgi:hypothetical protein
MGAWEMALMLWLDWSCDDDCPTAIISEGGMGRADVQCMSLVLALPVIAVLGQR